MLPVGFAKFRRYIHMPGIVSVRVGWVCLTESGTFMSLSKPFNVLFSGALTVSLCVSCSGQATSNNEDASVGGSDAAGGLSSTGGSNAGGSAGTGGTANLGGTTGTTTNPCGVCSSGQICVYQNGGPGPSHYSCATLLPCGAMSPCACIQNQGTCNIAGGTSGLGVECVCDNGLQ